MTLFHLTFPKKEICTEQEMYFRGVGFVEDSGRIRMTKDACISFDTFFNCFSYSRYKKYTNISTLQVALNLQGEFRVRLYMRKTSGIPEILSEQIVSHGVTIEQSLANLTGEGFIYAEIFALSDGVFAGGYYGCPDTATRPVKLAVCICTYRKEQYVYDNAAMLGKHPALRDSVSMLVVDNGQTLEHDKLKSAFDRAELFYNRNLGGSGGFTRGMIEAARSPEGFTHMCLMDDDVRFDPEVLYKTITFLSIVREEYANISVGGIMLELERPYHQYEMGGVWTGRSIKNIRSGFDIRKTAEVIQNEVEIPVDYNAWWFMCMPVAFVETKGLPMPVFIKGDDMDYGMRATEGIVLMNGIAVWHESFGKKYNGALEYYIKRNELILNALHNPSYGMFRELGKLLSSCGKQIVYQRYSVVDFIIRAYEDFLKGANFLLETDGEQLNSELMGENIPMLDDEALAEKLRTEYPSIQFTPKPEKKPHRIWRILTLYSYLIPRCFYNQRQTHRIIELADMCPVDFLKPYVFYKSECVIQYNSDSHRGFVTTLKKSEAVRFAGKFLRIAVKMLFGYRKAAKSYREKHSELTGIKSWLKRLGLEGKSDV